MKVFVIIVLKRSTIKDSLLENISLCPFLCALCASVFQDLDLSNGVRLA